MCGLAEYLWLKVTHEVTGELWTKAVGISRLTRPEVFVLKLPHVVVGRLQIGFQAHFYEPLYKAASQHGSSFPPWPR